MSKILCIYHSADLDGICSGAIMRRKFPNAEMFGYDYGKPFPWEKVDSNTLVYMADVSLPRDEMIRLKETASAFCWIDHHKSAMDDCDGVFFDGIRKVGRAACELCWKLFFPREDVPMAVHLLGRYDVWDKSDPRVDPFQYGARYHIQDGVFDELWEDLLNDTNWKASDILKSGILLYEYQVRENAKYAKARAFEASFNGLRVIACNKSLANSQLFDAVYNPEKHDAMLLFGLRPDGMWKCSMYTTHEHVDVSAVCKRMGGGGHQKAAGFISPVVPVSLGKVVEKVA